MSSTLVAEQVEADQLVAGACRSSPRSTSASIVSRPKTTKKAPTARLTISTWQRLADEQHQADVEALAPVERRPAARRPRARAARPRAGCRTTRNDRCRGRRRADEDRPVDGRRHREKICHISVVRKSSSAKIISSGTRRRAAPASEASWPSSRREHPAHDREQAVADHRVDQAEQEQVGGGGDQRRSATARRRSAAAAPAGATKAASSALPTVAGQRRKGRRASAVRRSPIAASRIASPPSAAATFADQRPVEAGSRRASRRRRRARAAARRG